MTDYSALVLAVARKLGFPNCLAGCWIGQVDRIQYSAMDGTAEVLQVRNGGLAREWNPATSDADSADLRRRMVTAGFTWSMVRYVPTGPAVMTFMHADGRGGTGSGLDECAAVLLAAAKALGVEVGE